MKVARLPNGEFYIEKDRGGNPFMFLVAQDNYSEGGKVYLKSLTVPKELVGKRIMFKVETVRDDDIITKGGTRRR